MQVCYDHQIFASQRVGGISRYFSELVRQPCVGSVRNQLVLAKSLNCYLEGNPRYAGIVEQTRNHYRNFAWGLEFRGKHRLYQKYLQISRYKEINLRQSLRVVRRGNFDLFHPTYYDPYFLDVLGKIPMVLTVYDMIHEKFSAHFAAQDHTSEYKRQLCHRASHIIAISQSTKADLVEIFGIPPEKITVIHLANSLEPPPVEVKLELPERYVLFVGVRRGYKNFNAFFSAMLPLLRRDRDLHLLCTGYAFSKEETELFQSQGVQQQVCHFFASDWDLAELYSRATCFVFPSFYEGFGLPILEAYASGCPVVVSHTSSLPEVGGAAALYVDPSDPDDIREKVLQLLQNPSLRHQLREKGYEHLRHFSWEQCCQQHAALYQSLL
ncbi:MAG: glycosyltransferase family 1 protein [Puniceicoccaceae bacterium]